MTARTRPVVHAEVEDGQLVVTVDGEVVEWKGEQSAPALRAKYDSATLAEIRRVLRGLE
jgi:hypothetical protein